MKAKDIKHNISKLANIATDAAVIPTSTALITAGVAITTLGGLITSAGLKVGELANSPTFRSKIDEAKEKTASIASLLKKAMEDNNKEAGFEPVS